VNKTKFFYSLLFVLCSVAHAQFEHTVIPEPCPTCASQIPVGSKWNYILTKPLHLTIRANVYDIDGFNTSREAIATIHSQQSKAICYLSAGTWEKWRPDAGKFPRKVIGISNGWKGEQWLDIRQTAILLPIMQARVDMCKDKGFDAIEFDNVDAYRNKTGFPIKNTDQFYFNALLANMAHRAGLAVGLKNDTDQIQQLLPFFDFAINEECFQYDECDELIPFIYANKAVLNVEYKLKPAKFCPKAIAMNFSSIKKKIDLKEPVTFCH
jgi:hypothetical protein